MTHQNHPVDGRCPSCGYGLLVLDDMVLRCTNPSCAEPDAAQRILADGDPLHVARIHENETFTMRHPLIERLDNRLMECELFDLISAALRQGGVVPEPGDYKVALVEDGTVLWGRA